jgi:hypothetical protein
LPQVPTICSSASGQFDEIDSRLFLILEGRRKKIPFNVKKRIFLILALAYNPHRRWYSLLFPSYTYLYPIITRVMTTKLTLTIDDAVISDAKAYAKNNGKSLSQIVENYLTTLTSKETKEQEISPRILKLMGSIELPEDFDYKKSITDALSKKYDL